ncbi:peptidase [Gardnerella vaginalis]|uniref:peptidase n=2 Tax=Gardnerella vaginalis TaxID=2702 RepID=UPI0039EF03AE
MINSNSGKHARKVTLDAAVSNAIAKAVDARKVAAFTVGAAGVLAGAAFAFGATPAMAAETGATPDTKPTAVTADENAGADKKSEDGKNTDAKPEVNEDNDADNKGQTEEKSATDNQAGQPVVNTEGTDVNAATVSGTDRAADPAPAPQVNSEITISKETKDTLPNLYAWGSSDNTYIENGQNNSVTINFAKPSDGSTITKVAIFPSDGNTVDNTKSRRFLEYYSASDEHQPYSGEYGFTPNTDGSATLTMNKLYRNNNMPAVGYAANRCIYVYGTDSSGKEVLLYKTNIARAATLVPPKTAGSIVLKYNQELTDKQIREKLQQALDAPTEVKDKKTSKPLSLRDQIQVASTANGVGGRTGANGAFVQTPDDPENKVIINDQRSYIPTELNRFNAKTSGTGAAETTYITTVQTLKTHLITDTGYTSDDLPLTVARYDDRIDKPTVEDPTNVSQEVKNEIIKKLASLNHVGQDKVSINDKGEVTINFDGVDEKDAPKIALRDLVLKKLKDGEFAVPSNDKAVFVANPLGYSKAELDRIKTAIFDANKDNTELGLTSKDQITLSYITGDTTVGHENIGISNGQAENTITVKIKTDKAVAEFTSDIKANKLTKLPNIRTDYDVTWTKTTIDGRDTDEGISWSNDQKTTIIYRYDPTKAEEFDTTKILGLLKATPKNSNSGLRDLTGGEQLAYEGTGTNARKSHMHYALQNGEPTGELTLGNMGGAYWSGNQKVSNSDVDLGDNLSIAGPYSWDPEAGPVTVAGKKDKIFKARLFVEPYAMTYYKDVYLEKNRHPGNTAKAINVIFVPQTNHKTSDLKTSVEEHKTVAVDGNEVPTQSAYYNASDKVKSDYDDALKVAKALYDQVKDTKESDLTEKQKADIDNATIKLDKARAALDGAKTDKDKLSASIEANGKAAEGGTAATPGTVTTDRYKNVTDQAFQTDDGKPDIKKNEAAKKAKEDYDKALEEAKALKDDANATQKAVDEAKAKLDAAREKLNEFSTNKDELNAAIAAEGKVNTGDTTKQGDEKLKTADPRYQNSSKEERKAYDDAVVEANKVVADPNASQKEVNEAIKKLKEAKAKLDAKATDKSKLIAAEKLSFDNPDKDDANKQSTFYKNALNKKTNGANEQEKQAAKTAVENYDNALQKAREVIADKNATQAQVDAAKDALTKAEDALHKDYASDPNELTKVLADNFSGYLMPAYFNAFDKAQAGDTEAKKAFKDYNDAYQKAKELKKNFEATDPSKQPTAKDIAAAKTALEEARKVIDKYATNTSRLSAAVFNDLAIQNSPAYANVKELADKQNPSEEEKAQVEAAKKAKEAYEAAVAKLNQALNKQMPRDKANGKDIPDTNTPDKDGKLDDKDYLKDIQAHAQGEPLDRDITNILKEMNAAIADLNKFATKTDELLKSVNEDAATHQNPAFKNASHPDYKNESGQADTDKNGKASKAVDDYGKALNEAKELLKNPAATQKEVNDALKKLDDARKELDKYNTDTTKLAESVKKHGSTEGPAATEGTQTSDAYRNASDPHFMKEEGGKLVPDKEKNEKAAAAKKAYDDALTKAQELLKKHDDNATPQDAKPTQKDINKALKDLDDARTEVEKYKTDTTALNAEAEKSQADAEGSSATGKFEDTPEFKNAKAKTSDSQTNTDVAAYQKALKKARDLVKAAADQGKKNSERPTQQQINDALDALTAAKKQITDNYKTNLEPLTSAKDFACGGFKKTPEYLNAVAKKTAGDQGAKKDLGEAGQDTGFDNILKKVADKLNDNDWKQKATQKDVNALLKQLQDAQDKIAKTYKTDAIKLEREVGDKDQDGNPVVPPFEASVAYKNALEKANAGDNDATAKLKTYADKLKEANDIINKVNHPDPNAKPEDRPTQAQVDQALTDLQNAKKAIDENFKTDVAALQTEVDDKDNAGTAKVPDIENTTEFANLKAKGDDTNKPDDLVAYEKALAKAKELIDKNDGKVTKDGQEVAVPKDQLPTQQEVDAAQKALKEIKDKILANYKTNSTELQMEVDKSKDGDDDQRDDVFENTPAFKNADAVKTKDGKDNTDMAAYKKALKDAKDLLDKFDSKTGKPKTDLPTGTKAPTQKDLDDALDALQKAKSKIEKDYATKKDNLKSEADANGDFTKTPEYVNAQAKGDDESKKALEDYKKALEDANKILGDKDATQAQVDEALKKLQDAKKKLTDSNKTDKSKLQDEADDDAKFRKSLYFIIGKRDDIEAYKKALAEADSVLNDPNATQAQVDEALRKLQAAKAAWRNASGASGNASALAKTGAATGLFASLAAVFSGLGVAGVASRRRKHSNE